MTTATTTLTDFLLARIEEDEGVAAEPVVFDSVAWAGLADRVLAECEAKRRIVAEHGDVDPCDAHDGATFATVDCDTLRFLALPYADHPDYREAWRP